MEKNFKITVIFILALGIPFKIITNRLTRVAESELKQIDFVDQQILNSHKTIASFSEYLIFPNNKEELQDLFSEWNNTNQVLLNSGEEFDVEPIFSTISTTTLKEFEPIMDKVKQSLSFKVGMEVENLELLKSDMNEYISALSEAKVELHEKSLNNFWWVNLIDNLEFVLGLSVLFYLVYFIYRPTFNQLKDALKKSRAAQSILRSVCNSLEDGVVFLGKEFEVKIFNTSASRNVKNELGLDLKSGVSALEYISSKHRAQIKVFYEKAIASNIHTDYVAELGEDTWLHGISPVLDSDGDVMGVVHIVKNITDVLAYQREIDRQTSTISEMKWTQSHEVREPLLAILGTAELIKEEGCCSADYTTYLMTSVNRLDDVIKKITYMDRKLNQPESLEQEVVNNIAV